MRRRSAVRALVALVVVSLVAGGWAFPVDAGAAVIVTASIDPTSKNFTPTTPIQVGDTDDTETFTVTGSSGLDVTDVYLDSGNDFSIAYEDCADNDFAISSTCTIQVDFTPASAGDDLSDTLNVVTSNALTDPSATLSGDGVDATASLAADADDDFGDVLVGTTSGTLGFTLTNDGYGDITVDSFASVDPDFSIDTDSCALETLAPADTCPVLVTFSPSLTGPQSSTLSIDYSAANASYSFNSATANVYGNGVEPDGAITPNDEPFDFGSVDEGDSAGPQTFTLTNDGTADLNVTSVSITGADDLDFTIDGTTDTCTGQTLSASGGTCTVDVTFTPTGMGERNAALEIESDASDSPDTAPLTGYAYATISMDPGSADFTPTDPVQVGETDGTETFTVTGSPSLDIILVELDTAVDFWIDSGDDGCTGHDFSLDDTCDIKVSFTPQSAGSLNDILYVTSSNAIGDPSATVDGDGADADATLTTGDGDAGSVPLGTTSGLLTYTFTNTGYGDVQAQGASVGDDFDVVTDNCDTVDVGPAGTCTVTLTFTPSTTGAHSSTVSVPFVDAGSLTATPNSPATAAISGTGTGPQPDAFVAKSPRGPYAGRGIVSPTLLVSQRVTRGIKAGGTAFFALRVRNIGPATESFKLKGILAGSSLLHAVIRRDGVDITSAVLAGTYTITNLAPGAKVTFHVVVTAGSGSPTTDEKSVKIRVRSVSHPNQQDVVMMRALR
ncbi:MAG: hypothetical protein QOH61_1086 [Chloroflexota bacterium]|jgi:hypothetical protein|nr:hypothetical protein [Chloroflexota bacterium]